MLFRLSLQGIFSLVCLVWVWSSSFANTPLPPSPLSLMLQQAQQAVVSLYVEKSQADMSSQKSQSPDVLRHPDQDLALGSGVILTSKGLIITSYHLVKEAQKIEVVLFDGRKSSAKILHINPALDLALLKCSASLIRPLPTLPLGPEVSPQVGETVWAIGHLDGLPQSVSQGIIAFPGRKLPTYPAARLIQTDILLGPGSSGGALVNQQGALIGITTAIFGGPRFCSNIGFAVGVPLIKSMLSSLP